MVNIKSMLPVTWLFFKMKNIIGKAALDSISLTCHWDFNFQVYIQQKDLLVCEYIFQTSKSFIFLAGFERNSFFIHFYILSNLAHHSKPGNIVQVSILVIFGRVIFIAFRMCKKHLQIINYGVFSIVQYTLCIQSRSFENVWCLNQENADARTKINVLV